MQLGARRLCPACCRRLQVLLSFLLSSLLVQTERGHELQQVVPRARGAAWVSAHWSSFFHLWELRHAATEWGRLVTADCTCETYGSFSPFFCSTAPLISKLYYQSPLLPPAGHSSLCICRDLPWFSLHYAFNKVAVGHNINLFANWFIITFKGSLRLYRWEHHMNAPHLCRCKGTTSA